MNGEVLCFGEILLRYSPRSSGQWINDSTMPVYVGGAELNVAMALAGWGIPVRYFSAFPDNYLSRDIINHLKHKGINVSSITISGQRIGTYYLEQGAGLRDRGVIYDRAGSSFSMLQEKDIDWDKLFEGVSWFHFSAISPALGPEAASLCKRAVEEASSRNIFISVDLNYREKLWNWGVSPTEIIPGLVGHCSFIMGNPWAVEKMLGIPNPLKDGCSYGEYQIAAENISTSVMQKFPRCNRVAFTFRVDNTTGLNYSGTLMVDDQFVSSMVFYGENIIDRVGSGDCFMAGLIYSDLRKFRPDEMINFAAAAAFDKLFIPGDSTTSTVEKIRKIYTNAI